MVKRPHTGIEQLAMPRSNPRTKGEGDFPRKGLGGPRTAAGGSDTPVQPRGEVSTQKGGGRRMSTPMTPYERGFNPDIGSRRERRPPGGRQVGLGMSNTDMPRVGHMSATAPGALARPGSEAGSRSMDARSSVPTSIQAGPNTRDRFTNLESNDSDSREDNAEIDAGFGTGRGAKGGRYRNLRY